MSQPRHFVQGLSEKSMNILPYQLFIFDKMSKNNEKLLYGSHFSLHFQAF